MTELNHKHNALMTLAKEGLKGLERQLSKVQADIWNEHKDAAVEGLKREIRIGRDAINYYEENQC